MSTVDRRSSESTAWGNDGDSNSNRDLTGVTLGDFQVEKLLGQGGMGDVYLATQLSLNRPVALKVLKSNYASNPTYLARLRSEATAVAKLNHPNIVHVYTLGCVDQINFIAMEYVQGTNLREYFIKKGALDLPLAFSIMRQTGQAVGAAGEVGLVHRDIKPENILITKKGRVKVADFGLCRDQESGSTHLTQHGSTMGTPLYMSPEQAQGHVTDHRSDLYSMGVTFYHMLAGVPPFQGDTPLALALKQVREMPRSMLIHRPDLPAELDQLVLKLMAKSAEDRYQSAALMLADLAKLRDTLHVAASAAFSGTAPTTSPTGENAPQPSPSAVFEGNKRALPRPSSIVSATVSAARLPVGKWLARLNPTVIAVTSAACLLAGAFAGWKAREPDLQTIASESAALVPGLWIEPRWETIPRQSTPEGQLRHALLQTPREDLAPAFLAVAGYFPHSHEIVSKAYTQLARIWYRRLDLGALGILERELSEWKEATKHDQELTQAVRIAVKLKKGDLEGVVEGMKNLVRDDVPDIYDPALVEMHLEICADAITAAQKTGMESLQERLHAFQGQLIARLYQIEVPKGGRNQARATEKHS
jgi:eukaryotic-like serine/threonine-protein kinase